MDVVDRRVDVQGLDIHYLQAGERGSPVVMLHGGGMDSARLSWGDLTGPVAESGHSVYAPDLPGYGLSSRPEVAFSTEFYITFVAELLDALGLHHAALAGLSMGGAVALGFTLRFPSIVDKLVLIDAYGLQRTAAMHKLSYLLVQTPGIMESSWAIMRRNPSAARAAAANLFHDPRALRSSLMEVMLAEAKQPRAGRAWTSYQRSEIRWNGLKSVYMDRLGEIRAPTLIIHGRHDKAVPVKWAEEAHKRIPGSTLLVIEDAGHWSQREKPEEVERALIRFLNTSPI